MNTLIEQFKKARIVPVVVLDDATKAIPVARALLAQGISVAEITFRTEAAEESIRRIKAEVPEMWVGAGTVLNSRDLKRAVDAGASFCVAPGLDPELLKEAAALGMPFVPGVSTASEVTMALNHGCKMIKFFPAEAAGGIPMLKSLMAAFGHCGLSIMPTGGITEQTMDAWFKVKGVVCVGGSWMMQPILQKLN